MELEGLCDNDLREQLAAYGLGNVAITEQTRKYFLKKLKELKGQSIPKTTPIPADIEILTFPPSSPQLSDSYYVLIHTSEQPRVIYESRSEAVKVAKCSGARFNRFITREAAEAFIQATPISPEEERIEENEVNKARLVEKEGDPYSSVKINEKQQLRKEVEKGKIDELIQLIWRNPKHLVSSGDCPVIYHEGYRRNILHCAADCGNLPLCKQVMEIIQSDQFWETLHPKDSREKRETDKLKLTDRYLNMQDGTVKQEGGASDEDYIKVKSMNTPLHIASMKGHENIVRFLMTFPDIDTSIKNYYGERAVDVACRRAKNSSAAAKEIVQLIEAPPIYYVPVVRSPDVSYIGGACLLGGSLTSPGPMGREDETGSQIIGQAFAGPLSPIEAHRFQDQWLKPCSEKERRKARNLRRSDSDRGLERIGRDLAHSRGVGWAEYWEFLSGYFDLSKPDGLVKLESYLSSRNKAGVGVASVSGRGTSPRSAHRIVHANLSGKRLFSDNVDGRGSGCGDGGEDSEDPLPSSIDHVIRDVAKLSLEEKGSDGDTGRLDYSQKDTPPDTNKGTSPVPPDHTPSKGGPTSVLEDFPFVNTDTFSTPSNVVTRDVYLTGDTPTKLDRDVLLALCAATVDSTHYPCVARWKSLVESHDEEERKHWPTPRSLQPTHRHDNLRPPLSPLLLSSSSPPNSPYLTNRIAHPGSGGLRTPRQQATPTRPSKQLQYYNSPFRN